MKNEKEENKITPEVKAKAKSQWMSMIVLVVALYVIIKMVMALSHG